MANTELYLLDLFSSKKAKIIKENFKGDEIISIRFYGLDGKFYYPFLMDKSTAIKFAKTLRTEINKIQ